MRRRLVIIFLLIASIALATTYAFIRKTPWAITHLPAGNAATKHPAHYYNVVLKDNVDSVYVIKHLREMYVYKKGALLKIYRIALGDAPTGHKHFQGDERTPDGLYHLNNRNSNSSCHKNLGISYPSETDRKYAAKLGKEPGGDLKIHGLPNGQGHIGKAHLLHDWTNGCIGITNPEIDELYQYVIIGSPIFIVE